MSPGCDPARSSVTEVIAFALVTTLAATLLVVPVAAQVTALPPVPAENSNLLNLDEDQTTVADLVSEVGAASGISMTADPRESCWWLRELPLEVHLRNLHPVRLQRMLADLLDLAWTRKEQDEEDVYTLIQTREARQRQADDLTAELDGPLNELTDKWAGTLQYLDGYEQLSAEEKARLAEEQPMLDFAMNDELGRAYVDFVGSMIPTLQQTTSTDSGPLLMKPVRDLPPEQQQAVMRLSSAVSDFIKLVDGNEAPPDGVDWSQVSLVIERTPDSQSIEQMGIAAQVKLKGIPGGPGDIPVMAPDSPMARLLGKFVKRVRGGEDMEALDSEMEAEMKKMEVEFEQQAIRPSGRVYSGDVPRESLPPVFKKAIELEITQTTPPPFLFRVAEATGLSVIAEKWPDQGPGNVLSGTVEDLLDEYCRQGNLSWSYKDACILLKSQNQARMRAGMIPREDLTYWQDLARKQKMLTAKDLGEIASRYTLLQISQSLGPGVLFPGRLWAMESWEKVAEYRLYNRLRPATLRAARKQIAATALNAPEREALTPLLIAHGFDLEGFYQRGSYLQLVSGPEDDAAVSSEAVGLRVTGADGQLFDMVLMSLELPLQKPAPGGAGPPVPPPPLPPQ